MFWSTERREKRWISQSVSNMWPLCGLGGIETTSGWPLYGVQQMLSQAAAHAGVESPRPCRAAGWLCGAF